MRTERRDFVKLATVGATGVMLTSKRLYAAWPSTGTMDINPDIDNMSVVYCCDPKMITSSSPTMTFDGQNSAIDSARVAANLDAMAMKLANKTTPDEAWKTIFRSGKDWGKTVVAIKVNTIEQKDVPRVAILQKISAALVGLGVSPSNIILYDAGGQAGIVGNTSLYSGSCSTTDKTKIQATVGSMGSKTSTPIGGGGTANCVQKLANGDVDILVNVAVNKGHSTEAQVTLCMKNHYGTFDPNHSNMVTYISNINKSDAIVGGTPPRQQLCIVDSIFAMKGGPSGTPDSMPGYLVMGVFAPAVDYLTAKKVREGVQKVTHTASAIDGLITNFGYKTTDPQWIEVSPASGDPSTGAAGASGADGGASKGSGGSQGTAGGGTGRDAGSAKGTGGQASGSSSSVGGNQNTGSTGSGGNGVRAAGGANGTSGGGGAADGDEGATGGGGGRDEGAAGGTGSGDTKTGHAGSDGSESKGSAGASSKSTKASSSAGASGDDDRETPSGSPKTAEGCSCELKPESSPSGNLGAVAVLGAVVVGQLGRLLARRERGAGNPKS